MNFKIENRIVNITNYPSIAKHLEDMASRGWLIDRIILGNIFIYKKIKAENLDFSIIPYEVETGFTRKTKKELKEFQTVWERAGWTYASESGDFHIYFKKAGKEVNGLEIDDEEEFERLEKIGNKAMFSSYIMVIISIFITWLLIGDLFTDLLIMKNALMQMAGLIMPAYLLLGIMEVIRIKKFLKINRKNIKNDKKIEYKNSKFHLEKTLYIFSFILLISAVGFIIYIVFVLKDTDTLFSVLPVIIGITIGNFYRYFIKPNKKNLDYKVAVFAGLIILAIGLVFALDLFESQKIVENYNKPNIEEYKVLSIYDIFDGSKEDGSIFSASASILVPRSYEYSSYNNKEGFIRSEYSNVLTEDIAKNLVFRYKKNAEEWMEEIYEVLVEDSIRYDEYDFNGKDDLLEEEYFYTLEKAGLTIEEFNKIEKESIEAGTEEVMNIIQERAMAKDKENLWNMDEVYFLSYSKDEIVLRDGKEVFYLEGLDFSDPAIIKKVKEKLNLH